MIKAKSDLTQRDQTIKALEEKNKNYENDHQSDLTSIADKDKQIQNLESSKNSWKFSFIAVVVIVGASIYA